MGCRLLLAVLLGSGCSAELMDAMGASSDAGIGSNAPTTDAGADAFMLGAWGPPMKVPGASSTAEEDDGTLSSDGLELVFAVANAADANRKDLYVATRTSTTTPFGTPSKLALSLTGSSEETPRFSPNDKTLYFASDRAGGVGGLDIYRVTRQNAQSPWSAPQNLAGPNTIASEKWFMPCGMSNDYLVIVGGDIGAGTVGGAAPTIVAELSAAGANETGTFMTSDCLTTYFASVRSGTNQIYTSHRTSTTTAWQAPTLVNDFTMLGGAQEDPWLATDGRTFLFVSNISGTKDLYISVR
ncbi:MAG: PD40 domain-containing protein [Deltaproteobacteria bacterium]|nr:PD40 domain-containing protein [Deltaproteobacteria bacterium]